MSRPAFAFAAQRLFAATALALLVLPVLPLAAGCAADDGEPTPEPSPGEPEQDAGEPEAPPPAVGDDCDPFTFVPVCSADTPWEKLTCEAGVNTVVAEDCREAIDIEALTTCGQIPCTDVDGESCNDFKVGCVQPAEGGRCSVRNRFTDGVPCTGLMGCIYALGDDGLEETCRNTTSCEFGEENAECVGNIATWCVYDLDRTITWETAQGVDCASFNATCGSHPELVSVCQGDVGNPCNTVDSTSVFHCLPGLECVGDSAVSAGTCETAE